MKKTVIVEFPDGFELPEKPDYEMPDYEMPDSKCRKCPFCVSDGWTDWCVLNGDEYALKQKYRKPCPFYGGNDSFTLKVEE